MSPARILVAVDDEHVRGLLVTVLRADGHGVDGVSDRRHAARMIDQHAYAVVLAALRMPGLDAPELVRMLDERRPAELPTLIFLARPAFAPDLARFLMEWAAPLLEWPATPAAISRVVARTLAARAPSPAPA